MGTCNTTIHNTQLFKHSKKYYLSKKNRQNMFPAFETTLPSGSSYMNMEPMMDFVSPKLYLYSNGVSNSGSCDMLVVPNSGSQDFELQTRFSGQSKSWRAFSGGENAFVLPSSAPTLTLIAVEAEVRLILTCYSHPLPPANVYFKPLFKLNHQVEACKSL